MKQRKQKQEHDTCEQKSNKPRNGKKPKYLKINVNMG